MLDRRCITAILAPVIAHDCFTKPGGCGGADERGSKVLWEDLTSVDELKELDEKRGDRMVSRIIKEGGGATALVAATVMPCCPLFA